MINLEMRLAELNLSPGAALKNQLSSLTNQSFTALLSEALSETLSKFGIDPSSVHLTFERQTGQSQGQSAVTRQFPAARVAQPATPLAASMPVAAAARASVGKTAAHWYASDPADDAYWAKQPAAVQQLREIDDIDQRKILGAQLAAEGYAIDVPIMIWGWDAGKITQARQSYGYTWVPSALQPNVSAAPGISAPGVTPYDPANPPAGSIQV